MNLRSIAMSNLRRRKAKAMFLLAGLTVGVASVVALITAMTVMEKRMMHTMEEYGANILVLPKSEGVSLNYAGMQLGGLAFDQRQLREADLARIPEIKDAANIRTVSPKLFGAVEADAGREVKAVLAGVDFAAEFDLKPWWRIRGAKPEAPSEIVLGADAARALGIETGAGGPSPSELTLEGRSFTVVGVLEPTGSQDDGLVFARLSEVQELLGQPGMIAMAEVAAHCANCPIEEITAQLRGVLPQAEVKAVQQAVQGRMDALASMQRLSAAVSAIVLLAGALVVFVTMMAGVNERTREIGIFGAIGFRPGHIMRLILLEATIISLAAGVLGFCLGLVGSAGLLRLMDHKAGHVLSVNPWLAVGALALALIVGLSASALPAFRASRLDPVSALRSL